MKLVKKYIYLNHLRYTVEVSTEWRRRKGWSCYMASEDLQLIDNNLADLLSGEWVLEPEGATA